MHTPTWRNGLGRGSRSPAKIQAAREVKTPPRARPVLNQMRVGVSLVRFRRTDEVSTFALLVAHILPDREYPARPPSANQTIEGASTTPPLNAKRNRHNAGSHGCTAILGWLRVPEPLITSSSTTRTHLRGLRPPADRPCEFPGSIPLIAIMAAPP
jgi:hypothetical protein